MRWQSNLCDLFLPNERSFCGIWGNRFVVFPQNLYSYSCLKDTDQSWLNFKITLLNSSARDDAKRGANTTTSEKNLGWVTVSILSWWKGRWARSVEGSQAEGRDGAVSELINVTTTPKATCCLDKPWGHPNWQSGAQSHLYSLSSGVQLNYKIYLSWPTPVRKGLATPF